MKPSAHRERQERGAIGGASPGDVCAAASVASARPQTAPLADRVQDRKGTAFLEALSLRPSSRLVCEWSQVSSQSTLLVDIRVLVENTRNAAR